MFFINKMVFDQNNYCSLSWRALIFWCYLKSVRQLRQGSPVKSGTVPATVSMEDLSCVPLPWNNFDEKAEGFQWNASQDICRIKWVSTDFRDKSCDAGWMFFDIQSNLITPKEKTHGVLVWKKSLLVCPDFSWFVRLYHQLLSI